MRVKVNTHACKLNFIKSVKNIIIIELLLVLFIFSKSPILTLFFKLCLYFVYNSITKPNIRKNL